MTSEFQEKKNNCIKHLFIENGILAERITSLSDEIRSNFIDQLLKIEDVQSAVTMFYKTISRHSYAILNPTQASVDTEMTNNQNINSAPAQAKVVSNGVTTMVDESSIKPVFQPINQTPPNQPASTVSPEEKQAISPTQPPPLPVNSGVATPPPLPSTPPPVPTTPPPVPQASPGTVPPANTPAAKPPTPNLEQARTTFSISANGKANVEFVGKIEGKSAVGKNVVILAVTIPQDLGLTYNVETSELTGVPLKAGEFTLNIHFQFDKYVKDNPTLNGECNLFINPDPKTLWKDLPSDETEIYWKKDTDLASMSGKDGLEVIVASKRGRSHAHVGSCRDDDFCLMQDEESGWKVITVADGAGSAKKSRKGSLIASRTATESVLKALSSERGQNLDNAIALRETDSTSAQKTIQDELYYLFGNAAKESVQAIDAEAKSNGSAYKDYSTTLIVTIHKKVAAGHFVAAYWVGDGGVGIYRKGQEVLVLGKADSGEFAGQTRFLDSAMLVPQEIANRIGAKIVQDFTSIIAMTDGITDPMFETDANIESLAKWDELWTDLSSVFTTNPPESGLLDWLDFWSAGNHDDRTIAIIYPPELVKTQAPEVVA
jgi:hypothetical protein